MKQKIAKNLNKTFNEIQKLNKKTRKNYYLEKILKSFSIEEIIEEINIYLKKIKSIDKISEFDKLDLECEEFIILFHYNEISRNEDELLDEVWLIVNELCYKALGKNGRKLNLPISLSDLEIIINSDILEENVEKVIKYILLELSIIVNLRKNK